MRQLTLQNVNVNGTKEEKWLTQIFKDCRVMSTECNAWILTDSGFKLQKKCIVDGKILNMNGILE
jgi:hypothetical protein